MTNRVQHFMRRVTQNSRLQREICINNKIIYQNIYNSNKRISINNSINNLIINNNTINKPMEKEEDKKRRKEKERQNEIELEKLKKDFLRKHNEEAYNNLEKLKKQRTKYSL